MPTTTDTIVWAKGVARRVLGVDARNMAQTRPADELGDPELRARIDALGDWFHNIDVRGTPTKVRSLVGEPLSNPAELWERFRPTLPDLRGKTVLDIGCNAGFFSVECKKLGADSVLGVDISQGTTSDVIAQGRFAAKELDLDIEFRDQDFMLLPDDSQWDAVLFLGVMYHLDDPVGGLRKAARLSREVLVVETAMVRHRAPVLQYFESLYLSGDTTSPWAPSPSLVDVILAQEGFGVTRIPTRPRHQRYLVLARRTGPSRADAVAATRL